MIPVMLAAIGVVGCLYILMRAVETMEQGAAGFLQAVALVTALASLGGVVVLILALAAG